MANRCDWNLEDAPPKPKQKITTNRLQRMKKRGEKIACLTAYDFLMASILDEAGIDLILVGDSAGMVFAGYHTTIPMTMEQMLYHASVVARGVGGTEVFARVKAKAPDISHCSGTFLVIFSAVGLSSIFNNIKIMAFC